MKDSIKTAKAKAAQHTRKKEQKTSEGDTNFLQKMTSTVVATHDRLGFLSRLTVPASH